MSKSRVTRSALPASSLLHKRLQDGDFLDCFSVASDLPPRRAADIITAFPSWAMALVRLRGVLGRTFRAKPDRTGGR